jgi:phosphodiester glycosidase/sporulation related protein
VPRRLASLLLVLVVVAAAALAAAPAGLARGLPLGPSGLSETRSTHALASGVRLTRIVRGHAFRGDRYTVSIDLVATRAAALDLARRLRADGFEAAVTRVRRRAPDDPRPGPLGWLVRSGAFDTEAQATALRDRLAAAGYDAARVDFTGEDGRRTTGPWRVAILALDPRRFEGRIGPALATGIVPGREKLTSMERRTGALAGVNGGYFVVTGADGTEGDLAGISVIGGAPLSEAVNGRTSLLLPRPSGAGARVEALSTLDLLRGADGASRELDGLNRGPGLIRSCGGVGGDLPTERPKHDFTCTDPSEVVRFTRAFGAATPPGPGAEAVLDAHGRVTALRSARGGPIPPDGSVLAGTGDGAAWLRARARPGTRVRTRIRLRDEHGAVRLRRSLGVVNGGPRLLRSGRRDITAFAEGFVWPEDPEFFWRFGVRRNPRTMAGVTRGGRLLLVTVDGHAPGYSLGLSFREEARVMRGLGARDAVNLDGGGSTTMAVRGRLVNLPSDDTGERPVGDALLLTP